jgi:hypothetical protein
LKKSYVRIIATIWPNRPSQRACRLLNFSF